MRIRIRPLFGLGIIISSSASAILPTAVDMPTNHHLTTNNLLNQDTIELQQIVEMDERTLEEKTASWLQEVLGKSAYQIAGAIALPGNTIKPGTVDSTSTIDKDVQHIMMRVDLETDTAELFGCSHIIPPESCNKSLNAKYKWSDVKKQILAAMRSQQVFQSGRAFNEKAQKLRAENFAKQNEIYRLSNSTRVEDKILVDNYRQQITANQKSISALEKITARYGSWTNSIERSVDSLLKRVESNDPSVYDGINHKASSPHFNYRDVLTSEAPTEAQALVQGIRAFKVGLVSATRGNAGMIIDPNYKVADFVNSIAYYNKSNNRFTFPDHQEVKLARKFVMTAKTLKGRKSQYEVIMREDGTFVTDLDDIEVGERVITFYANRYERQSNANNHFDFVKLPKGGYSHVYFQEIGDDISLRYGVVQTPGRKVKRGDSLSKLFLNESDKAQAEQDRQSLTVADLIRHVGSDNIFIRSNSSIFPRYGSYGEPFLGKEVFFQPNILD